MEVSKKGMAEDLLALRRQCSTWNISAVYTWYLCCLYYASRKDYQYGYLGKSVTYVNN